VPVQASARISVSATAYRPTHRYPPLGRISSAACRHAVESVRVASSARYLSARLDRSFNDLFRTGIEDQDSFV
jgi:hypothetical protein